MQAVEDSSYKRYIVK